MSARHILPSSGVCTHLGSLFLKDTVTDVENKFMVTRRGGINWEIGTDIYTLLHIK